MYSIIIQIDDDDNEQLFSLNLCLIPGRPRQTSGDLDLEDGVVSSLASPMVVMEAASGATTVLLVSIDMTFNYVRVWMSGTD